jgi:hypothetical protein
LKGLEVILVNIFKIIVIPHFKLQLIDVSLKLRFALPFLLDPVGVFGKQ